MTRYLQLQVVVKLISMGIGLPLTIFYTRTILSIIKAQETRRTNKHSQI